MPDRGAQSVTGTAPRAPSRRQDVDRGRLEGRTVGQVPSRTQDLDVPQNRGLPALVVREPCVLLGEPPPEARARLIDSEPRTWIRRRVKAEVMRGAGQVERLLVGKVPVCRQTLDARPFRDGADGRRQWPDRRMELECRFDDPAPR